MNNIQEKDWADDSWCGHTGMDNFTDYCVVDKGNDEVAKNISEKTEEHMDSTEE